MELNKEQWPAAVQDAYDYLGKALPEADALMLDEDQRLALIRQALLVRKETPWGHSIPEDLFSAYVLFPRVNNEDLTFYQPVIWEQLRDRVLDKSMAEAVLEVNRWCCEHATYQSTDGRTLNALSILRRTYGRCGEESTLLVSALRSVGIPARQIYVPRWAHCDDNHAWVEAWTDGEWHYLGACEPEPTLDSGWFTAAASKAMLVHTHAYGVVPDGERIEKVVGGVATINRTAAYARTALLTVCVTRGGLPAQGVTVRFELANYGEFFPIIEKTTDISGKTALTTGLGTLHLHIHDGERFVTRMAAVEGDTLCAVDMDGAVEEMTAEEHFAQYPPMETRIQPFIYTEEVAARHAEHLRLCEESRAARMAAFHTQNEYCGRACGNHQVIEAFLALPQYSEEDKRALLDTLRHKDFVDVTLDVLTDALDSALPEKANYPAQVWKEGVLCPRVRNEMLYPVRGEIRARLASQETGDPQQLLDQLRVDVRVGRAPDARLTPDARAMLSKGYCPGEKVFDILYVICARALGMAARLNPLTGEVETWTDGAYQALNPALQADSALRLVNGSGRELRYGPDFTIAVLENGAYRTLWLHDATLRDELVLPVFAGAYRVMTCTRQINGAVDGILTPVSVERGERAEVVVRTAPERISDLLVKAKLPVLHAHTLEGAALDVSATLCGNAIVALVAPGQEPTEHFFNELLEARDDLTARNIAIRLVLRKAEEIGNEKLQRVLREVGDVQVSCAAVPEDELAWRQQMHAGDLRLPFETAVNGNGEGLFSFVNYNVGSVQSLLKTFTQE